MLTMTDLFCGAGGSSTGAVNVNGVEVMMAANHWQLAVTTHNTNHPGADHDCADISQVDPRRYRSTDILWASPECTNHSQAKGKTRKDRMQPWAMDSNGRKLPDDSEERSRATMWDVVRFTEYHRYRAVIVENVVEACFWAPFRAWLAAMDALGYEHQIVFMNSAHAQAGGDPAAQSRDRLYVVFHRKGDRRPNVERWTSPSGTCTACGHRGQLIKQWKPRSKAWPLEQWGRYGHKTGQYVWGCVKCAVRTEPDIVPAFTIIDWTLPTRTIGERKKLPAAKTMARIEAGIRKHRGEVLGVPVEGRERVHARPMSQLLRCQTARNQTALVVPFMVELRGGGSTTRSIVHEGLATVTAGGNHHYLTVPPGPVAGFMMRNNGSKGDGSEHCTSLLDVARTLTTKGHQSLVHWDPDREPEILECGFRMLEPHEIKAATALDQDYVVLGTKRDQVRMLGNAVTPPAARDLVAAVVEALEGSVTTRTHAALAA